MADDSELLAHYRPWLRTLAASMTAPDRAEDLAQEGWVALWRAHQSYDGRAPLDFWLKRKAHTAMLTMVRDWSRTGRIGGYVSRVTEVAATEPALLPELPWPIQALEMAYHQGQIHRAIAALTPTEREYVLLRFWGDYKRSDMIEHFGYEPHGLWRTARPKLAEALENLRVCHD